MLELISDRIGQGVDQYLWGASVLTAIAGGILSVCGTLLQGRAGPKQSRSIGHHVVLASYALFSISVLLFAIRGFMT